VFRWEEAWDRDETPTEVLVYVVEDLYFVNLSEVGEVDPSELVVRETMKT